MKTIGMKTLHNLNTWYDKFAIKKKKTYNMFILKNQQKINTI